MLPLPAGGLEGRVLPGRRVRSTSAARRTGAGCSARTCAATCASSRKHRGAGEAERARQAAARGAAAPRRAFRGERGRLYREAARWLASGSAESLLTAPRP